MFEPHKLEVYRIALGLLSELDEIAAQVPPGKAALRDQLERAGTSIVLNIAEGAGEFSLAEKQRFYRIARRSGTEVVAILDIFELRNLVATDLLATARRNLTSVISMLTKLATMERG